ncbi:hypothetical protein [Billgrantia endophytica]|nr:hypothetical protein [Halomonas endophytica]
MADIGGGGEDYMASVKVADERSDGLSMEEGVFRRRSGSISPVGQPE